MGTTERYLSAVRARRRRPVGAVLLVAALGATMLPGAAAAQSETPAEKAAREIQAARDQANAAAEAFFDAQSTLDVLEVELEQLEDEAADLEAAVDDLRGEVEDIALARYVDSGTAGIPLLTAVSGPQDQIQAEIFTAVLTNTGTDVLDEYDAAQTALSDKRDEVTERRQDVEDQREEFARLEEVALAEVVRLQEVEEQRLKDEAVRKALEAQRAAELAAEQAAREEEERIAAAEAEARAQADAEAQAQADAEARAQAQSEPQAQSDQSDTADQPAPTEEPAPTSGGGSSGGGEAEAPSDPPPTEPPPPPPTEPPPPPPEPDPPPSSGIVCPMRGSAYSDTWGAARSGGRSHLGVDMLAPVGTPIFAAVSGKANFGHNGLGGNAVNLFGDNGNRYYYAHLSAFEGSSRHVSAGEVIGYNGDTGNARGTPHLHFEVWPGGSYATNPYPVVRAAGC